MASDDVSPKPSTPDGSGGVVPWVDRLLAGNAFWTVVIVVGLIVITQVALLVARREGERIGQELLDLRESVVAASVMQPVLRPVDPKAASTQRLSQQLVVIRARKAYHANALKLFMARYYAALAVSSASAVLAAALLLLITRQGWDQAHSLLKIAFLTATGLAAFYGPIPKVFKQEENASLNGRLYVKYSALEQEMLTFLAVGAPADAKLSAADIAHGFDRKMSELDAIAIGFDATALPDARERFSID